MTNLDQRFVNEGDSLAGVQVDKNTAGSPTGEQPILNLIEGSNITLTIAEDGGNNRVNITIAASGGGGVADLRTHQDISTIAPGGSRALSTGGNKWVLIHAIGNTTDNGESFNLLGWGTVENDTILQSTAGHINIGINPFDFSHSNDSGNPLDIMRVLGAILAVRDQGSDNFQFEASAGAGNWRIVNWAIGYQ